MNKNDDLVNGRWSNKFYVAIDYNFCSFIGKTRRTERAEEICLAQEANTHWAMVAALVLAWDLSTLEKFST